MSHKPLAPVLLHKLILAVSCVLIAAGCSAQRARPVSSASSPETVCPGAFVEHYQELVSFTGCKVIVGDLTISSPTIRDLAPLAQVESIDGTLTLRDNDSLRDLNGLDALVQARDLSIVDNHNLRSLQGLDRLVEVRRLVIDGNNSLRSTFGLTRLQRLTSLVIQRSMLSTIYSLPLVGLETLILADNPRLHSVRGLAQLRDVSHIQISNNPLLCGSQSGLLPQLVRAQTIMTAGNLSLMPAEVEQLKQKSGVIPTRSETLVALDR